MLLLLDDDHKDHLSFLNSVDRNVVKEFFSITVDFLRKGVNAKVYQTASQKMGVPTDTIRQAVEGLMHLLSESTKLKVSPVDFQDSIMALGFSKDLQAALLQLYESNCKEIRSILSGLCMNTCHYHDLEWRLDVHLASRELRRQITPMVLMKLKLDSGSGVTTTTRLQTDQVNLVHLMNSLDGALKEIKGNHCRRIARHIR